MPRQPHCRRREQRFLVPAARSLGVFPVHPRQKLPLQTADNLPALPLSPVGHPAPEPPRQEERAHQRQRLLPLRQVCFQRVPLRDDPDQQK